MKKVRSVSEGCFCPSSYILTKKKKRGGGGSTFQGKGSEYAPVECSRYKGIMPQAQTRSASALSLHTCELGRAEHNNKAFILSHGIS